MSIQTFADHTGDNSTTSFAFSFPYLDDSHVVVQVDQASVSGGAFVTKALTTDYTIQTSPSSAIIFNSAPATGDRIRIKRDSASNTALVDFENGSVLTEVELDRAYLHNLYLNEEIEEGSGKNVMTKNSAGNFEADLAKIVDVADPTLAQDAATKNYVDTQDALQVTKTGDSMTGELAMGSNKITGLATPTATTDAVNKSYADGLTFSGASEDYVNQQISNQITGSSTASSKYTFAGNGSTTAFTFSPGIDLNGDTMYEVAIDGVMQEPTVAYAIDSTANTITFTSAPPNTSNIVVIQRGYSVPVSAGLTLSSIENIANNTLLGNDSGSSAAPQALTSTEVRTVLNVADGSTANDTDANLKNRANHTGTQTLSTISDAGTAAASNTGDFATAAQGVLADSAVQNGDNSIALTSTTGNVNMELGGATGFVSFIDLKNPSTDDYDVRVISDDITTLDTAHTSRARIEGHNSLGLCAGDTSAGPIPEVLTVTSSGVKLKGTATQLFFEDTDETGTPTEIAVSLNDKALRFGFQDAPSTQAFAIFGRNLTIAGGTVAEMNALTAADGAIAGQVAHVSNGNAGSHCLAMYDGSAWKVIATLGATISA